MSVLILGEAREQITLPIKAEKILTMPSAPPPIHVLRAHENVPSAALAPAAHPIIARCTTADIAGHKTHSSRKGSNGTKPSLKGYLLTSGWTVLSVCHLLTFRFLSLLIRPLAL